MIDGRHARTPAHAHRIETIEIMDVWALRRFGFERSPGEYDGNELVTSRSFIVHVFLCSMYYYIGMGKPSKAWMIKIKFSYFVWSVFFQRRAWNCYVLRLVIILMDVYVSICRSRKYLLWMWMFVLNIVNTEFILIGCTLILFWHIYAIGLSITKTSTWVFLPGKTYPDNGMSSTALVSHPSHSRNDNWRVLGKYKKVKIYFNIRKNTGLLSLPFKYKYSLIMRKKTNKELHNYVFQLFFIALIS